MREAATILFTPDMPCSRSSWASTQVVGAILSICFSPRFASKGIDYGVFNYLPWGDATLSMHILVIIT